MTHKEKAKLIGQDNDRVKPSGKCACGHMQLLHTAETGYRDRPNTSLIQGHGYCMVGKCTCPQFTWTNKGGAP